MDEVARKQVNKLNYSCYLDLYTHHKPMIIEEKEKNCIKRIKDNTKIEKDIISHIGVVYILISS